MAFIGASNTPRKWGYIVLANILNGGFEGRIYPINPKEENVHGLKAYADISELPETPDLAVIVIPPPAVPAAVAGCVAKGVRAALIITAGFAEVGPEGERLQREMVEKARAAGMVLVGPNCNGIMRPSSKLYSMMPPVFPPPGPVAVVAQSGNVGMSLVKRAIRSGFGCSAYVSAGNAAALHCQDYFEALAADPETKVILSYIEGFRDGRGFFEVARRLTKKKPIVVLKAGGTEAGAQAALSHTASLSGDDKAFDGACRQAGVIRVREMEELFKIGAGLIRQPLPQGKRVGIVTAGGGWGVLASDACVRAGLKMAALPEETLAELDEFLPAWWTRSNPVDLVAGLRADHLRKSLDCLLRCPAVDGVILLGIMPALPIEPLPPDPSPEVIENRVETALEMIGDLFDEYLGLAESHQKPVIVASEFPFAVGDMEVRMARALGERGHMCYNTPEDAAMVMGHLVRYAEFARRGE